MGDDLVKRLESGIATKAQIMGGFTVDIPATQTLLADAAAEITRLRAKDYAADKLAEVYWKLRSYAFHDDDCTFNRHPTYRCCSCGLKDALDKGEATIRVFQPEPAATTDYEIKLAQLKEDFPNGI